MTTAHHELHYGFCETNLYENAKYWGNFDNLNEYIFFLENYTNADLFKILEGDKNYFLHHRPANFYDFFFELMDQLSEKQEKSYWTIKLDAGFFHDKKELEALKYALNERYDEAKYIIIQREFKGYIRSYMNMIGKTQSSNAKKQLSGVTGAMFYQYFYPRMSRLLKNEQTLHLNYESLINNYKNTLDQIAEFVGYSEKPLYGQDAKNVRNTSFTTQKSGAVGALIRLSNVLFRYIKPLPYLLVRIRYALQKKNTLPPLWWRLTKAEHFKENFKTELEQTGQLLLMEQLEKKDKEILKK